jgi:PAS domain-containing protein/anti-sigma regulatory factor (Ser/Thr protein kinase)
MLQPGDVMVGAVALLIAALTLIGALVVALLRANDRARAITAHLAEAEADAARWRDLLDRLPHPLWWYRPDLTTGFANRAAMGMSGGAPGQADGALATVSRELAQRALAANSDQSESLHLVVGGQRRLFEVTEAPLASGGLMSLAIDHTAVEALQSDLARHVDAAAEVLETLGTAIAIYGPDRRLKLANRAFANLWRLDADWLQTEPTIQEVLEALRESRRLPEYADFPEFKRAQVHLFQSLTETREELLHLPDETTLRMVVTPHPFGGLMFTYEDVTDKLALERSYNTLTAVQRETLDNLHEGVAVIGSDGRLKLFNPAYCRIWEFEPERLADSPALSELIEHWRRFFPVEAEWEVRRAQLMGELAERRPSRAIMLRGDGTAIEHSSVPLPDGATLFTYVEVTDRLRVETALRTILGFAEILANQYFGELTPRQLEYSRGILESSHRLLALINDILDLATIEAGYMALEHTEIELHGLLANVLSLMRERARNQQITLLFDCPPNIGALALDARRIKQALFNLLSNAFKFTPPGGTITLAARRDASEVLITVTDTGVGIPEHDQARVFERFERASRLGRHSGAGLGLSLVKSFVELHGGRVEMTSVEGQGTVVVCHLPIVRADPVADPASRPALPSSLSAAGE